MKEKLLRKIYTVGWRKIILSVLAEIIIIAVCISFIVDDDNMAEALVSGVCMSLVALIHFFQGINMVISGTKPIYEYIEKSGYTYQQLEQEFLSATKLHGLYIGSNHVFARNSMQIVIVNINDIQEIKIRHTGENYAKGRAGYYYLYLIGENITQNAKIYFVQKVQAKDTIAHLIQINKNINVVEE